MNCSPNYIVKILLKFHIILQTNSEWVEISQQHYRKPLIRTSAQHYFETSTRKANRIYMNNSLPETNWKNGFVSAFPNEVRQVFTTVTDSSYTAISERPDTVTNKYIKTNPPVNLKNKNKTAFNNLAAEDFIVSDLETIEKPKEDNFTSELSFSENDQNINDDRNSENVETPPTIEVKPKKNITDSKANALGNIIKLVKIVADTITRNTRGSVNSKTKYLRELKNTILRDIETRIETLWPDDAESSRRMRRSQRGSHVEFPSSESALMSISFLTFAVFLIKLILQFIQTYKNKAMVMNPVIAAVGRAANLPNNIMALKP